MSVNDPSRPLPRQVERDRYIWHQLCEALGGCRQTAFIAKCTLNTVYQWQGLHKLPGLRAIDRLIAAVSELGDLYAAGFREDLQRWRAEAYQRWATKREGQRARFVANFGHLPDEPRWKWKPEPAAEDRSSVIVYGPLSERKSGLPIPEAVRKQGF